MKLIDILDFMITDDQENRYSSKSGLMFPSEAGGCNRAVYLRLNGEIGSPFNLFTLRLMNAGIAFEDMTEKRLKEFFGERLSSQVQIKNNYYSGKLDFVIDHCGENPVIIEHKAKGDKNWWDAKLPEYSHIVQAALYLLMYEEVYGKVPTVKLLYITYNQRAEFDVSQNEKGEITVKGIKENVKWTFKVGTYVLTKVEVDEAYPDVIGKILSQMDMFDKKELPPVLPETEREKNCTFAGKPSCKFYKKCF